MARLLGSVASPVSSLRELFEAGEMVLAPGCYDALGARLVEEAGFPAAYMTGSVEEIEAVAGGFPDVPLLFNYAEGGKTPPLSYRWLRELGFSPFGEFLDFIGLPEIEELEQRFAEG